jgi:hypothetical protein
MHVISCLLVVDYLMTQSVISGFIASENSMIVIEELKRTGRKRTWSNRGTVVEFTWRDWGKSQKHSVLSGVPAEISASTSRYTNLFVLL